MESINAVASTPVAPKGLGADGTDAAPNLAEALRNRRTLVGMTQAELAKQAGLSTSFISQLERANTDATISTLNRICAALGTSIGHLFAPPQTENRVIRKDSYRFLNFNGVDKFVLTRDEMQDVDVCLFEFPPASGTGLRSPAASKRTELWVCQSEYLGIDIEGEVHILRAGDSMSFPSSRPNTVYNPGPNPCEAILVIKVHDSFRSTP